MASSFWTTSTKAFGHSILVSRYWRPGPSQSLGRQLDCSWIAVLERWHVAMDIHGCQYFCCRWMAMVLPVDSPWGFFRPRDQYDSEEYHQLLIRWFQFGVFTPIFRVHGAGTHTEIWNFGMETMNAINTSAITLRYRQGSRFHDDIIWTANRSKSRSQGITWF